MNRFTVLSCVHAKEEEVPKDLDYNGEVVVLSCTSDPSFVLFFPISQENAEIITCLLNKKVTYDINTNVLGLYKTMIDSWRRGDRYLAGIIMDAIYDQDHKEDVIMIRLALADNNGELDSLVHINFVHAMLLAVMEQTDIIISDKLLMKLIPEQEELSEDGAKNPPAQSAFPEDKELLNIVKNILSPKQEDESNSNKDNKDNKTGKNGKTGKDNKNKK